MKNARSPKNFYRSLTLAAVGLLAYATLSAADSPTDSAPPPPPPAAPPAAGAWYVFSPPKEGVVLTPAMREKMLSAVKSFLDRSNPAQFAHVKEAANPFYPKLPPAPAPVVTTPGATAPAGPTAVAQVSPADKLQQVADQLKPSGALIFGQNRLISVASGDTLSMGQTIQVTFPGDGSPTVILLQEVTSDSYSLKLGDTTKSFPYVAKEGVSHPNPPTSPPQPKKP